MRLEPFAESCGLALEPFHKRIARAIAGPEGAVEGHFEEFRLAVGERRRFGDFLLVEWSADYGDGAIYRNVTIAEIEDDEAVRVTDYWGKPFDTPDWREEMTDRLDMPADGRWPSADRLSGH